MPIGLLTNAAGHQPQGCGEDGVLLKDARALNEDRLATPLSFSGVLLSGDYSAGKWGIYNFSATCFRNFLASTRAVFS
jgi:hypothetical protein